MTIMSLRRRAAVLAVTAGTVLTSAATVSGPAAAASTYYGAVSMCSAPAPGRASCFAMKRVRVASASVPGARKAAVREPGVAAGPAGGFTPGDIAKAYGVNPAAATTQTVAIVDAYNDPNARADLNVFDLEYGLPAETSTSLRIVGQTGSGTALPANDSTTTGGWSVEESLDLDAVRGLCNKCRIILVEANAPSNADLAAAVDEAVGLGATEVSNSYGGVSDASDPTTAADIAAYNHKGVVITASTGDDGYYDWDNANYVGHTPPAGVTPASSDDASTPAAFSTVVAVGGTTLQLNDDGTRSGESVWNENGNEDSLGAPAGTAEGATGGGCSMIYSAAKWQLTTANYAGTGCGSKRLSADVSALADPYTGYDVYDSFQISGVNTCTPPSCWATFGGTSLASPLIASMWALAGGSGGVSYPALSLYGHFKAGDKSLYDVTVGGNGLCGATSASSCGEDFAPKTPNTIGAGILDCAWNASGTLLATTRACRAATGYDGPSGVGTPNGLTAFKALSPTAVITASSTIVHGKATKLSAGSSKDPFPGGVLAKYSWNFGDHTTSTSASPTHAFARKATYTVTLSVTDSYGRTGTTVKKVSVG